MSNIAWNSDEQPAVLHALRQKGITGVEVALTKIWGNWKGASPAAAAEACADLNFYGMAAPAIQSLLFGRPDLQLFGDKDCRVNLVEHITQVARLGAAMRAEVLVFGSPRNRDRGSLSEPEAQTSAIGTLRAIGDNCAEVGMCFCLEPNPVVYDCNFLVRWEDAAELVARVSHPGVGLHLDTACIALAGDDVVDAIAACGPIVRHFHVSEPFLRGFADTTLDHRRIGAALRGADYQHWISIEMRRTEPVLETVTVAADFVTTHYA